MSCLPTWRRPPRRLLLLITKRPTGYVFAHVEGASRPTVNGNPLVGETVPLRNGDVIELAGTQMQFVQG